MSSPIHKYLFSPPPSPPSAPSDGRSRSTSPALTSLRSLLPLDNLPRLSLEGSNELKSRSPRTPQQSRFTLDSAFPTGLPTRKDTFTLTVEDHSVPASPRRVSSSTPASPGHLNVPTAPVASSYTVPGLPRPVIRLLVLASLVFWSALILVYIPSARLPSLRTASASRRLALAADGRAYVDVMDPISGWTDAKDRDYVPPQVFANRLSPRAVPRKAAPVVQRGPAQHPPKATRPIARPLPASHELLALQSYILQSTYNVLPFGLDPSEPLDANLVLGYSAVSDSALAELEAERAGDVVVWSAHPLPPHDLLNVLSSVHGTDRHPTLISLHGRPDLPLLLPVLKRLGMDVQHGAAAVVGNKPVAGDVDDVRAMRESGELEEMLRAIGWVVPSQDDGADGKGPAWKPKMAKMKKRELSEVEHALAELRR